MVKLTLITSSLLLFTGFASTSKCLFNIISEQNTSHRRHSVRAIARKIRGEFYLKSVCLNKFMDDPFVVKMIRQTLVNYRILSESEALLVRPPYHWQLTGDNSEPLFVTDGKKWAWSKYVTWHIESYSKISTFHVDDHFFRFIAYFSPKNYLWLKNLLTHDPKFSTDRWFLGALVQVLNDNNFDSVLNNIPWTASLPHIFHWNNRLEKHMGHFGPWERDKSETINLMINRGLSAPICQNINNLIHTLRYFFNDQTVKNNLGMMLDVEWSYDSGDYSMTLQSAHVW